HEYQSRSLRQAFETGLQILETRFLLGLDSGGQFVVIVPASHALEPVLLPAQVTDGGIGSQAVQPGAETALAGETADLAPDLDEDFLRGFFRHRAIAGHPQAQAI